MVRRAIFWTFASQLISFGVQFGGSIIVARLLTPIELGIFAIAMAVTGIVQIFAAFGVSNYVIREDKLTEDTVYTAFTINALLSLVLSAIIFVSSFVGSYAFSNNGVGQVLRWMAITPVLGILTFRPSVLLQRAMQLRGVSILSTASVVVVSGVTIASAIEGASYMSPAYGIVAGALCTAIGTAVIGREHLRIRLSLNEWRPITSFGLRLMTIGGVSNAAVRLSDIILGHFLGLATLGLYSRASGLSNMIFTNVYGSATRVVFAKLSEAKRDGDRVSDVYLRGYRVIVAVMAPLLLGLSVLAGPAVKLLYGEHWLGAAVPLSLLLIAQFISLTFAMNWELFVIRDELKTQTRLEMTRSFVGIVTQTLGAMVNITVAASSNIFDNIISYVLYQKHMPRLANTAPQTFYRMYAEALMLAVTAAAPALVLMVWNSWSPGTSLFLVFGSVGIGGVLWLAAIVMINHPICDEIDIVTRKLSAGRLVFIRDNKSRHK